MGTIKINNQSIAKLYLGNIAVKRAYSNGSIVYDTGGSTPCFEVVDTISQATGNYIDVYVTSESKWYKKNNLSQFEEYGLMPVVSDLSTTTYYSGKLVYYDTGNGTHQYKSVNGQWVDLGYAGTVSERVWLDKGNGPLFEIGYYWGEGYKMVATINFNSNSYNGDMGGFFNCQNKSPIELSFYAKGFYYDMHDPLSTTSNDCDSGDYSVREMNTGVFSGVTTNTPIELTIKYGTVSAKYEESGTSIGSWGSARTGKNWYNGLYVPKLGLSPQKPFSLSTIKVYNQNDVLVNDLKFIVNSGSIGTSQVLSVYDAVLDVTYNNTNSNVAVYHVEQVGDVTPIEEYDTKVAPANHVHYSTLVELELMECPWVGMQATVGSDYIPYLYTVTGWVKQYTPCFEVVETISQASGYYVDVYVTSNSKWYKRNNLNQYEEYGVCESTDDLSEVTYYTGKLVILNTNSHEYKWNGSQWVDLGEVTNTYTEYEYVQGNGSSYIKTDYKPNANTSAEIDIEGRQVSGISDYEAHFFGSTHYDPSNGNAGSKRFKLIYYGGSVNIRYDYALNQVTYGNSSINSRSVVKMNSTGGYLNNTKVASFNNSLDMSDNQCVIAIFDTCWYNIRTGETFMLSSMGLGGKIYRGKIYNVKIYEGDTLVRNYVPAIKDNVVGMYETVNGVMWGSGVSTPFTVGGSSTLHGDVPEDYPTKVAPADNVHYDTLEELELMECPWIGMTATIGQDYTIYVYTEDGWLQGELPLDLPYIRFTPSQDATFTFTRSGLKYSINGKPWKDLSANTATPTVASGSYIMFKGMCTPVDKDGIGTFSATGNFAASGNVMSLLYDDDFTDKFSLSGKDYAFMRLFRNCTYLNNITDLVLPATTLSTRCYCQMFSGNRFSTIPSGFLPATTMALKCYVEMFTNNSSLVSAPSNLLPAMNLAENCYGAMFNNCSSFKTPPALPAMVLTKECYSFMFSECRNVNMPELPATTLAEGCYGAMFNYRRSNIPEGWKLPATTLAKKCYEHMFANGSMTSVPIDMLPATTLAENCYYGMFLNESSLTVAPVLPAETLVSRCYENMFQYCTNIKEITALFTTTPGSSYTYNWMSSMKNTNECTFHKNPNATWDQTISRGTSTVLSNWNIVNYQEPEYLKFTVVEDSGSTFKFSNAGLEYSIDNGDWTTLPANTNTPLVAKDHNIRFRGYLAPDGTDNGKLGLFSSSGRYNASGNICTLMYCDYYYGQTGKIKARTFQTLFQSSKIVDASALILPPVNGNYMYYGMFKDSKSLVTPPAINFTNAAYYGCLQMFSGCSSMTTVPSVTFVGNYLNTGSLQGMFSGCRSIVDASPIIFDAKIGWDALNDTFRGCSSLQTTPIMKQNLSQSCARGAFTGCSSLTTITYLGTTTPNSSKTPGWLPSDCTATFYMNENATWDQSVTRNSDGVPSGCTIVKIDPTSV